MHRKSCAEFVKVTKSGEDITLSLDSFSNGIISLFEALPETLFWIKDRNLRIIALNQAFADRVNLPKTSIIGKTDADLYFPELARVFMADDHQVIRKGQAIYRKFELLANRFGGVEWRVTTKLPLRDPNGKIIGTTGISRPVSARGDPLPAPYQAFSRIVDYAREHLSDGVEVEHIAKHAGMSVATLARRFREHMGLSPGEFLAQLRISRACKLLKQTPLNVNEIASECGYESASAFSRAFRRQMSRSPSHYRNQ